MWLTFKIVFEITFSHFLKRNDNNNTTFAIYSPDRNSFTVSIPQKDVGGQHCPCPVLVSFFSGFSGKSCPVSVCCPDFVCLDSISCPDSVRTLEKRCPLFVICWTRTRQSCPHFHCPCPLLYFFVKSLWPKNEQKWPSWQKSAKVNRKVSTHFRWNKFGVKFVSKLTFY